MASVPTERLLAFELGAFSHNPSDQTVGNGTGHFEWLPPGGSDVLVYDNILSLVDPKLTPVGLPLLEASFVNLPPGIGRHWSFTRSASEVSSPDPTALDRIVWLKFYRQNRPDTTTDWYRVWMFMAGRDFELTAYQGLFEDHRWWDIASFLYSRGGDASLVSVPVERRSQVRWDGSFAERSANPIMFDVSKATHTLHIDWTYPNGRPGHLRVGGGDRNYLPLTVHREFDEILERPFFRQGNLPYDTQFPEAFNEITFERQSIRINPSSTYTSSALRARGMRDHGIPNPVPNVPGDWLRTAGSTNPPNTWFPNRPDYGPEVSGGVVSFHAGVLEPGFTDIYQDDHLDITLPPVDPGVPPVDLDELEQTELLRELIREVRASNEYLLDIYVLSAGNLLFNGITAGATTATGVITKVAGALGGAAALTVGSILGGAKVNNSLELDNLIGANVNLEVDVDAKITGVSAGKGKPFKKWK